MTMMCPPPCGFAAKQYTLVGFQSANVNSSNTRERRHQVSDGQSSIHCHIHHAAPKLTVCSLQMLLQSKLVRSQSCFQLLEHFVQEGVIGRSQHSEVFRVRHRGSGDLYAVKKCTRRFASKAHRDRSGSP